MIRSPYTPGVDRRGQKAAKTRSDVFDLQRRRRSERATETDKVVFSTVGTPEAGLVHNGRTLLGTWMLHRVVVDVHGVTTTDSELEVRQNGVLLSPQQTVTITDGTDMTGERAFSVIFTDDWPGVELVTIDAAAEKVVATLYFRRLR